MGKLMYMTSDDGDKYEALQEAERKILTFRVDIAILANSIEEDSSGQEWMPEVG